MSHGLPSARFVCWYCGQNLPRSAANTDEHIVLAAWGGTLDLSTRDVCDDCQNFTGRYVDAPLARSWPSEARRVALGITRGGKIPILNMGILNIERPERFEMLTTAGPEKVVRVTQTRDGEDRAFLWLTSHNKEELRRAQRVARERLSKHRVIWNQDSLRTDYDRDLAEAIHAQQNHLRLTTTINPEAFVPGLVKIALGLACFRLGESFVSSSEAAHLRSYIQAANLPHKQRPAVNGCIGLSHEAECRVSSGWALPKDKHAVALMLAGGKIVFYGIFFERFEAIVPITSMNGHEMNFPTAHNGDGLLWLIDPKAKKVDGPEEIFARLVARDP